jgi:hypothetical protein
VYPPRRALAGVAQTEAEAYARGRRDGGSAERVRWATARGRSARFRYTHQRTGGEVEMRQAVRVPRDQPFDLRIGAHLVLVCWA